MNARADTLVHLAAPNMALQKLAQHMAEHGLEPRALASHQIIVEHEGCSIELDAGISGLSVTITAPSENMLYFLKEAAAQNVAEIDAVAAEKIRWSDGIAAQSTPSNFRELAVVNRREIFPGMMRITLKCDDVRALTMDGLHVKLMLPSDRTRKAVWPSVAANGVTVWPRGNDALHVRYFTLRDVNAVTGEVDIDVVQHQGGMISDWAACASIGDKIGVMGPGGGSVPSVAGRIFLAGDKTALPAIARIMDTLPASIDGTVFVAGPTSRSIDEYLPSTKMRVNVFEPERFDEIVIPAIEEAAREATFDYAWFAGEFDTATAARRLFKGKFGLKKANQLSVSYWRRGLRGNAEKEEV